MMKRKKRKNNLHCMITIIALFSIAISIVFLGASLFFLGKSIRYIPEVKCAIEEEKRDEKSNAYDVKIYQQPK